MLAKMIRTFSTSDQESIILLYRYLSWILTSLFYLVGEPNSPIIFKMGVVVFLFLAAQFITIIYKRQSLNIVLYKTLIIIETIGITLLLIPTGGLNSPFIWYALNPVLVAASYLSPLFGWLNLTFYIITATSISYFYTINQTFLSLLSNHYSLILAFILITSAVQLLSKVNKELVRKNECLFEAIRLNQMSIQQMMSLYQTVEAFTSQDNKEEFMSLITEHATKLTNSTCSFFWMAPNGYEEGYLVNNDHLPEEIQSGIYKSINHLQENNRGIKIPKQISIGNHRFLVNSVDTTTRHYGLLGIEISSQKSIDLEDRVQQLNFLAELSSIMLGRFDQEEMYNKLIIADEQNRIANEVHDRVSQRLFSLVCAIHLLLKRENYKKSEIEDTLQLIKREANEATQELRSCIYRLSSRKKDGGNLLSLLKNYTSNLSLLNAIHIDFLFFGEEEDLNRLLKKSIYRLICEATSNSIRHGKCKNITLHIHIQSSIISIGLEDDGIGFDMNQIHEQGKLGLGITNMKNLVHSFGGEFLLTSRINIGTQIEVTLPKFFGL